MTTRNREPFIVAIDGPAGSGKSTVGSEVSRRLGLCYVDTGAMYRTAALAAMRAGADLDDEAAVARVVENEDLRFESEHGRFTPYLNGKDVSAAIRTPEVDRAVPKVARWPKIRENMIRLQRDFGREAGVVMEGRDIGTVVFPDAAVKVFLDAAVEERARRRMAESGPGPGAERGAGMLRRDEVDRTRVRSPLQEARDAIRIDSTDLTIEQVVSRVLEAAARAGRRR